MPIAPGSDGKASERVFTMASRNAERYAQIETEARRMAKTGIYLGYRAIASRLVDRGYAEAPKLFRNRWTQQEIDRLCYASRLEAGSGQPSCPVLQRVDEPATARAA